MASPSDAADQFRLLQDSEARYRLLFESNPLPMWVFDRQSLGFLAVNDAAVQHYGYARQEFLAMTLRDIRPPEEIPALLRRLAQNPTGLTVVGVQRHRKKDGTIIWVETTRHTLTFEGRVAALVVVNDITERRRLEEALRQYALIIESSGDAILSASLEGIILTCNPGTEQVLGYPANELEGKSLSLLVPPERRDELQSIAERVRRGEQVSGYETVRVRKDGRQIEVSLTVSSLHDREGRIVGTAGITRDITERKRLEKQLRLAQKMEAVGQLAGGIAHDFNNLLTGIIGHVHLLLDDVGPDSDLGRRIRLIGDISDGASGVVRQLLAFGRRQVLDPVAFDLNGLVRNLTGMVRPLIGEPIDLRFVAAPGLGTVRADPGQIEQVLMNLVVNARDAMPDGGTLLIETANVVLYDQQVHHETVRPGPYVMLAVTDTGCGMDKATQERLFEPFFTTKEVGKGTGLGLSTAYGIIDQHRGYIRVYSERGRGTTFKIYLPRADQSARPLQDQAAGLEVPRGAGTILLAEDDEVVRSLARQVLESHGYTVLAAANADLAEEWFLQRPDEIALLVTDFVMPGRTGQELYQRLAQKRPELKVLYISGYADLGLSRHTQLSAESPFLSKPFTPDALARKVWEVMG